MPIVTSPVRKATWDDEPQLKGMIFDGYVEQDQFKPSAAKIDEMMRKAFDNNGAIIGAIGIVGSVEGIIYLSIGQFEYTDEWALFETFNYVHPDYRRSTNAKDLINFGKRCAEEIGLPLMIGVVSNVRTKAKVELYRRQLSEPVGAYFAHNLSRKAHA